MIKTDRINNILLAVIVFSVNLSVVAGTMEDDPLIGKVMINQFEKQFTDGPDPVVLEAQGWLGKDLHKLWIKIDAERVAGENEEVEVQALYSRAVLPFWDFQAGWRRDFRPLPNRDWLVVGIQGLAPYWFEIDTAFFLGESGRTALRFEAEYEVLFTQRIIMTPEIEINAFGKDDIETGVGSGLSDLELGLRLRYEIVREFAPYIGVNWINKYGTTADFARAAGGDTSDAQFVLGVRAWF